MFQQNDRKPIKRVSTNKEEPQSPGPSNSKQIKEKPQISNAMKNVSVPEKEEPEKRAVNG